MEGGEGGGTESVGYHLRYKDWKHPLHPYWGSDTMSRHSSTLVCWTCFTLLWVCASALPTKSPQEELQYRFKYHIQDENTGDYKTQEESKYGDTINGQYTVAEPNGDLRVVTYTADQHRGFQAQVEVHPGGSPMKENLRMLDELRSVPRNMRTGFTPVRPKSRVQSEFSTPITNTPTTNEESKEVKQEFAESTNKEKNPEEQIPRHQRRTGFNPTRPKGTTETEFSKLTKAVPKSEEAGEVKEITNEKKGETITTPLDSNSKANKEKQTKDNIKPEDEEESENITKEITNAKPSEPHTREEITCRMKCIRDSEITEQSPGSSTVDVTGDTEEDQNEGRAHIRPDEDKVQVEMEQVIRAEMQDPTTVKLGVPLEEHRLHYQNSELKYKMPPHFNEEILLYRNIPGLFVRNHNKGFIKVPVLITSDGSNNSKRDSERVVVTDGHKPKTLNLPRTPQLQGKPQPNYMGIPTIFQARVPQPSSYPMFPTYAPGFTILMIPQQVVPHL